MKRYFCLFISIGIILSLFLQGCKVGSKKINSKTATSEFVNTIESTANKENVSSKAVDEKTVKMRNKYKINLYVTGQNEEVYKPDSDGNLSLYDCVPYYNVLDQMYIKYNNAVQKSDNDTLFDLADEYEKTLRKASDNPDFYVTDYKNGVCINRYEGESKNIVIPTTLDGKKVMKIGGDISVDEYDVSYNLPFVDRKITSITLSSTVKEIVLNALDCYDSKSSENHLENIYVDSNNPYYASVNGILYNKDKTCLLQIPSKYPNKTVEIPEGTKAVYCINASTTNEVIIPSSVISFGENYNKFGQLKANYCGELERSNYSVPFTLYNAGQAESFNVFEDNKFYSSEEGIIYDKNKTSLLIYPLLNKKENFVVPDSVSVIGGAVDFGQTNLKTIIIGKNVKKIDAYCDDVRDKKFVVKGYKNTEAEKWAKKQQAKFEILD